MSREEQTPKTLKELACAENVSKDRAECSIQQLATILKAESGLFTSERTKSIDEPVSQTLFNVAMRNYFELLKRENLEDEHFGHIPLNQLTCRNERGFQIIYSLLLTDHMDLNPKELIVHMQSAMTEAINENANSILMILKTINLLCKKFNELDIQVTLEQFYRCLQNGQNGLREETLKLFQHCCRQREHALKHFQFIICFWPWTNRNKYYLLSAILKLYSLNDFLSENKSDIRQFFAGLRLSLNYKSLLAASQYLVKSLSNQDSKQLLDLSVVILTSGTLKELQNFYSQWFLRINQKDKLFEMLQNNDDVASYLESASTIDCSQTYRLILIVNMFPRQLYETSKLHFFKISTELLMNCFELEMETQWLVFKFITENFAYFAFEDCLEFISAFLDRHKNVEDAQYRNKILGKMPSIINFISKTFGKLCSTDCSAYFYETITHFFQEVHNMVNVGITSDVYQPKIFSLKLLEILLCSLYAKTIQKNSKNCSVLLNQQLGLFLQHQQVFDPEELEVTLVQLLCDPVGFDDARELMIVLLKELNYKNTDESFRLCREFCVKNDIDQCVISASYTKVAINSFIAAANTDLVKELYKFAFDGVTNELEDYQNDPLLTCKTRNHLYGYLSVINEIVFSNLLGSSHNYEHLIDITHKVTVIVLEMLSTVDVCKQQTITAASFQDMDESLELLVQKSSYRSASTDDHRKFLLQSFWLTLKACCELAANISCVLPASADVALVEQCLKINEAVLTRCRHKGAIEAAGATIGKLTRNLSLKYEASDTAYQLLFNCLDHLLENTNTVSTTRRGAGYSIMFLHVVKNDEKPGRPILKYALRTSLDILHNSKSATSISDANCDRIETLVLHYLCVLVKDTELRDSIADHYDEIMMAAIVKIDDQEWTICNAALQLFGALVPKIVGQRQATEYEEPVGWEPIEISYCEVIPQLPQVCEYILNYCLKKHKSSTCIRSIILFLNFLSKVEHLQVNSASNAMWLQRFRELMWDLLQHNCEKVRKLAAKCFVCMHEFRVELPHVLLQITNVLFGIQNENLFQGFVFTLFEGYLKLKYESNCVMNPPTFAKLQFRLNESLRQTYKQTNFTVYTLAKLLDLLELFGFSLQSKEVRALLALQPSPNCIGYDVWLEKVQKFSQNSLQIG